MTVQYVVHLLSNVSCGNSCIHERYNLKKIKDKIKVDVSIIKVILCHTKRKTKVSVVAS